MIYKLNFPNGNVQEYGQWSELNSAAKSLGGEAKLISRSGGVETYAFVQK